MTLRHSLTCLLLLFVAFPLSAQTKKNSAYINYINQYKSVAIDQMHKYKIPASITLAQGLLESGAGQSRLARQANNHFGIKCHNWSGKRMYHDDDEKDECFRSYNSAIESYEDHSKFLRSRERYSNLFKLKLTDYKGWAKGLKSAGYATASNYASKLINIIELYDLDQYDRVEKREVFVPQYQVVKQPSVAPSYKEHTIYMFNKLYYLKARQGDTWELLEKELGISAKRLKKYNELDERHALSAGDIVYLNEKKTKAPKQFKKRPHVVKSGESMYTISQMYGIKLESLYKLNNLPPEFEIQVGDVLRVR